MATNDFRVEHDSMGDVRVPAKAYYGAQTQRAVENFPISGWPLPAELIHALGRVKHAAAIANRDLGKLTGGKRALTAPQIDALLAACREVVDGKFDDQFPIDVFQTGSGTSSNMNANEVISQSGHRTCRRRPLCSSKADSPERSRQHGAIDQRHVSDGDSCRGRGRHS